MTDVIANAQEILVKLERALPKLVWKDAAPDSRQTGLQELIAHYRPRFFHGTGEGFFVTLTTYDVPSDEDPSGAVAYEGTIVRLPAEVAERVAKYLEDNMNSKGDGI